MEISEIFLVSGVYAPLVCALAIAAFYKAGGFLVKTIAAAGFAISLFSSVASFWKCFCGCQVAADSVFGQLGLNGVSAAMYLLAGIVGFAAFVWTLSSPKKIENITAYLLCMLAMQGGLMGMFASQNILWMYAFHEFALVPTFIAMCVWGGEKRRAAAMEMAIYLTFGALLALLGIIALAFVATRSLIFNLPELVEAFGANAVNPKDAGFIFAVLAVGLGALVSLFPLHSWAPKTYEQAPTAFSMLHAGVLKKFGLYVLIQVAIPLLGVGAASALKVVATLALFNVIFIGLCTMAQTNFKAMVSYSSVSHMGLCFLGIASMSVLGAGGCVLIMFGHGLSVAALFIFAEIVNDRFSTCDMRLLGGAYKKMPVCAGLFAAAIMANIGLPGFANFWGEFCVFISLWNYSAAFCALAVLGIIISAIYGLRAVANIFLGGEGENVKTRGARDISWRERAAVLILLAALVIVGFCPRLITNPLNGTLSDIASYNLTQKSAK
ncbi:MAG: NADH-quinone oxidoreductase subunit M [Opitutales bacterium]|nr:NADH-quinone oxidoreductase subunit M [Opitutales bacterium]